MNESGIHADLGLGATHHGPPDECGCWRRAVARLELERDELRAKWEDADTDRQLREERELRLRGELSKAERQRDDAQAAAKWARRDRAEAAALLRAMLTGGHVQCLCYGRHRHGCAPPCAAVREYLRCLPETGDES